MTESETDPYDSIVSHAERDEISEADARAESLREVSYKKLQSIAGHENVYEMGKGAVEYRNELAELGFFFGPVGDDTLYQRVEDETMYFTHEI